MLDAKFIHDECSPVLDEDLREATKIGLEMLDYCKRKNLLCLAANQVGCNRQVCVVAEDDGLKIYFNPEIEATPVEVDMFSVEQESTLTPMDILSFPKNKVMVPVVDDIGVSAFNLSEDDRVEFTCSSPLSHVWQTVVYILGGIHEDDLVARDFLTYRRIKPKKQPNAICLGCGYKNKKCNC